MRGLGDSIAILEGFDQSSIDVSPDAADGRIGQVRPGIPGFFGEVYDPSPDDADGRIGQTRSFPNQYSSTIAPGVLQKLNMIQASNGANYAGGSSFYPGAPTMPASIGLAGVTRLPPYGRAGLGAIRRLPPYGRAGLGLGAAHPAYGSAGLGACGGCSANGSMADADLAAAFNGYDQSPDDADGRIGQTRSFPNDYATPIGPGVLRKLDMIQASNGANYAGGSSFYPGAPTMPASIGLADMPDQDLVDYMNAQGPIPNVLPPKYNVVDPSGGSNYTGGASFAPGMPLLVSSAGLAELGTLDALDQRSSFPNLGSGRAFFDKLAGKSVVKKLLTRARIAKTQRNVAELAKTGRQLAIARRVRRAVFAMQGRPLSASIIAQIAAVCAQQVAQARKVPVA